MKEKMITFAALLLFMLVGFAIGRAYYIAKFDKIMDADEKIYQQKIDSLSHNISLKQKDILILSDSIKNISIAYGVLEIKKDALLHSLGTYKEPTTVEGSATELENNLVELRKKYNK